MCGIFGMLFLNNKNIKADVVKDILKKVMVNSQARGPHATGLSFAKTRRFITYKHNVNATKFLSLPNTQKVIDSGIGTDSKSFPFSVIGHTRYQTQGCHTNPVNNHPIICGNLVGVHNGSIINDDNIFDWIRREHGKSVRLGQVDSEAIFSGINFLAGENKVSNTNSYTPVTNAVTELMNDIRGSLACALQDAENPQTMWLFRRSNPIDLLHFEREGMLIFASDGKYIKQATMQYNIEEPTQIVIPEYSGLCINLIENKYTRFEIK